MSIMSARPIMGDEVSGVSKDSAGATTVGNIVRLFIKNKIKIITT